MTVQGHCPWDLKKGQVGYWSPSPMYTFYKVSTLPPLGTRLICLAQEGMGAEGRESAQCRGEAREEGQDWSPPRKGPPATLTASWFVWGA